MCIGVTSYIEVRTLFTVCFNCIIKCKDIDQTVFNPWRWESFKERVLILLIIIQIGYEFHYTNQTLTPTMTINHRKISV